MGSHSNAVGTLTLAADSALVLGEGHLAFAASQASPGPTAAPSRWSVPSARAACVSAPTPPASRRPARGHHLRRQKRAPDLASYLSPHSRGTLVSSSEEGGGKRREEGGGMSCRRRSRQVRRDVHVHSAAVHVHVHGKQGCRVRERERGERGRRAYFLVK
jgi:hypothetical protein